MATGINEQLLSERRLIRLTNCARPHKERKVKLTTLEEQSEGRSAAYEGLITAASFFTFVHDEHVDHHQHCSPAVCVRFPLWLLCLLDKYQPVLLLCQCMADSDAWQRVNTQVPIRSPRYAVFDLAEGKQYKFRVSSANMYGTSEPSEPTGPIETQELKGLCVTLVS